MIKPKRCVVPQNARTVLPAADYADAYEAELPGQLSAMDAARKVLSGSPRWEAPLLVLRNALVKPFGLASSKDAALLKGEHVSFFPVLETTQNRVVLGLDDRHLNFRLVVDAKPLPENLTHVTLSTVITRHNLLGRIYLAMVLPFHKLIVPSFLRGGQTR
jgi:Protein of unknown function (DUF2867)